MQQQVGENSYLLLFFITWYTFEESVLSDERQLWSECFP